MVMDPEHPEQEKELEQFYLNFAQPNNLTVKQCLIVAMQVVKDGSYGLAGWQGEQGYLVRTRKAAADFVYSPRTRSKRTDAGHPSHGFACRILQPCKECTNLACRMESDHGCLKSR